MSFSPYGDGFVSGDKDGQVKIYSDNFTQPIIVNAHNDKVVKFQYLNILLILIFKTSVKFNPDGQYILSVSSDKTYKMLWAIE